MSLNHTNGHCVLNSLQCLPSRSLGQALGKVSSLCTLKQPEEGEHLLSLLQAVTTGRVGKGPNYRISYLEAGKSSECQDGCVDPVKVNLKGLEF